MKNKGRFFSYLAILIALSFSSNAPAQSVKSKSASAPALVLLTKANDRGEPVGSVEVVTDAHVSEFREILNVQNPNPILLNNIGVRLGLAGRYEDANTFLEKAVEVAPETAPFAVNLAIVKIHLDDNVRAHELLTNTVKRNPSYTRSYSILCDLLTKMIRHQEAVECFEGDWSDSGTIDAASMSNYALSLMETGKLNKALKTLRRAVTHYPHDPGVMNAFAVGLYKAKKFSECVEVLTRLVDLQSNMPQYRFNLSVALLAANERDEAIEQYNLLKKADPDLAKRAFRMLFGRKVVVVRDDQR